MIIQEISKERFDSYNPLRERSADNALTKEVAWFENNQSDVIGVIVETEQHEDFAAVSLTSTGQLRYQAYDLTVGISSFSEAKEHLRNIM
jgi:hypothetical protein